MSFFNLCCLARKNNWTVTYPKCFHLVYLKELPLEVLLFLLAVCLLYWHLWHLTWCYMPLTGFSQDGDDGILMVSPDLTFACSFSPWSYYMLLAANKIYTFKRIKSWGLIKETTCKQTTFYEDSFRILNHLYKNNG